MTPVIKVVPLVALIVIVGVVVLIVLARRGRPSEPPPHAMNPRTKWIAAISLGVLVLGIGGVIASLALTPSRWTYETTLSVRCPGGKIYFGDEFAGEDRVTIQITGDESFLLTPTVEPTVDDIAATILTSLPVGSRLPDGVRGAPTWHSHGRHSLTTLPPLQIVRADDSVDWVVPVVGEIDDEFFCFLIRAREGRSYKIQSKFSGGGGGLNTSGFFGKTVVSRRDVRIRLRLDERPDDGVTAWVDRFPEDALSLTDEGR